MWTRWNGGKKNVSVNGPPDYADPAHRFPAARRVGRPEPFEARQVFLCARAPHRAPSEPRTCGPSPDSLRSRILRTHLALAPPGSGCPQPHCPAATRRRRSSLTPTRMTVSRSADGLLDPCAPAVRPLRSRGETMPERAPKQPVHPLERISCAGCSGPLLSCTTIGIGPPVQGGAELRRRCQNRKVHIFHSPGIGSLYSSVD